jgi:hypothetical protein
MHRTFPSLLITAVLACGQRASERSLRIALEVTNGPHAGRYAAIATPSACSKCETAACRLVVRFTDPDPDAALSSLQIVLASDGGLYVGVLFGGFRSDGRRHEIETRAGRPRFGMGRAVVNRRDDQTSLEISGRTEDGMTLTARMQCPHAPAVA